MENPEILAARHHLAEVRGLDEWGPVIERAEARLHDAISQSQQSSHAVANSRADLLDELGLHERIVDALRRNAASRDELRLLNPAGLRSWIDEGNDLVKLTDIGRVSASEIVIALKKLESK